MIGRRAVIGLSLLSALIFCAFAAQSASAEKSVNTTAFTCVKSGGSTNLDFADEHCDEPVPAGTGKWEHKKIPLDETTGVEVSSEKVTNGTKDDEPAVLKGAIGLTKTEISCTEVIDTGSTLHNVETEKKHTLTGEAKVHYNKCEVLKPAKCTVKAPIVTTATVVGVEKLGAEANTMGIEYKGIGEKENFATITFEGAECALKGQVFEVRGSVVATSGPTTASSQTNKYSGATVVFTPEKEMEKLKFGANTAEFTNIATLRMDGGDPITATTGT